MHPGSTLQIPKRSPRILATFAAQTASAGSKSVYDTCKDERIDHRSWICLGRSTHALAREQSDDEPSQTSETVP